MRTTLNSPTWRHWMPRIVCATFRLYSYCMAQQFSRSFFGVPIGVLWSFCNEQLRRQSCWDADICSYQVCVSRRQEIHRQWQKERYYSWRTDDPRLGDVSGSLLIKRSHSLFYDLRDIRVLLAHCKDVYSSTVENIWDQTLFGYCFLSVGIKGLVSWIQSIDDWGSQARRDICGKTEALSWHSINLKCFSQLQQAYSYRQAERELR